MTSKEPRRNQRPLTMTMTLGIQFVPIVAKSGPALLPRVVSAVRLLTIAALYSNFV